SFFFFILFTCSSFLARCCILYVCVCASKCEQYQIIQKHTICMFFVFGRAVINCLNFVNLKFVKAPIPSVATHKIGHPCNLSLFIIYSLSLALSLFLQWMDG